MRDFLGLTPWDIWYAGPCADGRNLAYIPSHSHLTQEILQDGKPGGGMTPQDEDVLPDGNLDDAEKGILSDTLRCRILGQTSFDVQSRPQRIQRLVCVTLSPCWWFDG